MVMFFGAAAILASAQ